MEKKKNTQILIIAALSLTILFMSIGFALYGQNLDVNGTASVKTQGNFSITSVTLIESSNVKDGSVPAYTNESIDLNLVFEKGQDSQTDVFLAKYSIILQNDSFFSYDIDFSGYEPIIRDSGGNVVPSNTLSYSIEGLEVGESIPAGTTREVIITINFTPEDVDDTYDVEGELEPEIIEKPNGTILAALPEEATGDLTSGNNIISVPLSLISTFLVDKTAQISINNPNFVLCDSLGNPISSILVNAETSTEKMIYIKLADGAMFSVDSIKTGITLRYSDSILVNCGSITIAVDIDESFIDTQASIISNVVAEIQDATSSDTSNNNVGSIKLSWSVDDEAVDHYTVMIYSVSSATETLLNQYNTNDKFYIFTGLADGDYVFKVYGTDSSDRLNTASQSDINNATTAPGYCCKSSSSSYDWHYSVTTNLTYATESDIVKKVNRGYDYTTTVTKNDDSSNGCGGTTKYSLPDTITVKMNSVTISSGSSRGQYSYTGSSSVTSEVITVYGVTGDLDIIVKGTSS